MASSKLGVYSEVRAKAVHGERLKAKRDALKLALGTPASEAMSLVEAKRMRGAGWIGDLDDLRSNRLLGPHRALGAKRA